MATPISMSEVNSIEALRKFCAYNLDELFTNLDFKPSDNGKAGNFNAQIIDALFIVADTDYTFPHNLERTPTGYIVISRDTPCVIYGNTFSASSVTLKSDTANSSVKILII